MVKRIIALALTVVMTLGLVACNDKKVEEKELIKVGIVNCDLSESSYRVANDKDLRRVFNKENGFETYFAYSVKVSEQIDAVRDMISDEVEYILLVAADVSGWDEVLLEAKNAGIKVILFDRTIDADPSLYVASVISDMYKQGETAVKWLESQDLPEYNIIHIQGATDSAAQIGRTAPLDKRVNEHENWKYVVQQSVDWSEELAEELVQGIIDSGEKFNVIYAENDDMAKGAVKALDDNGITHGVGGQVIIMGFDCNRWALVELFEQRWNYDGQSSPFHADYIKEIIDKLEKGEQLEQKTIILDERGFDATTILEEEIDKYGI